MSKGFVLNAFYDRVLRGNLTKELVKVLLEKAGYHVVPYGYESTLSDVKKRLAVEGTKKSKTVRKLRSSPDLLVYDERVKDVMFAEVKMRNIQDETEVRMYEEKIAPYREFWDECILILVVPCGNVFYAQKVSELEKKKVYDMSEDFRKIEDIFTRVSAEDVLHFREIALQIMRK